MRRDLSFLAVVALLLTPLAGCPKDAPSQGGSSAASASAAAKTKKPEGKSTKPAEADEGAANDEKKAEKKPAKKAEPPRKTAPKALSAEETKSLAAYQKAMDEGRKATRAKKYEDAVAAFDKALAAVKDDARAYGERGYARILAKDFKAGLADLDKAASLTSDKKLLAMIWFNYGLAAEGAGDAEKARAAFARSDALNPTKAAKAKLAGKTTCAATFDASGDKDEKTFDDWKAAYEDTKSAEELDAWTGDATLAKFCQQGWKKGNPCVHTSPEVAFPVSAIFVQLASGKVVRHELGVSGGRCGGLVEASIASIADGVIDAHVRVEQGVSIYVGMNKAGEMVDCQEGMECQSACADPAVSFRDVYVDDKSGKVLLDVTREAADDGKDPLRITPMGRSLDVKGASCDRSVTIGGEGE